MVPVSYLIRQKLIPPVAEDDQLIVRSRLIQVHLESRARIHCLIAPGGFGKSSLLLQLAHALGKGLVWYRLDRYDNDLSVFLRHLVSGVQQHCPDFGREILSFIDNIRGAALHRAALSLLLTGLASLPQPMTLAFDDCHTLDEPEITSFLVDLLANLPAGTRILIAGRRDAFKLSRMLVAGTATRLGPEDLAFTTQEIRELANKVGPQVSPAQLESIETATGRWPLAVRLLLSRSPSPSTYPTPGPDLLLEYIATEVVAEESEDAQRFLSSIAVLEEITADYCDLLLQRSDSRRMLSELSAKYFFLMPYSDRAGVYRYHQVFRDFFLERLGDAKTDLLRRAGRAACHLGDRGQGIDYLIAAGDHQGAVPLIVAEAGRLLGRGNWHTVERWLSSIPSEDVDADPWLTLFRAQVALHRGGLWAGDNWINHALSAFADRGDARGLAEAGFIKAKTLRYQGRYQESLDLLESIDAPHSDGEGGERFDHVIERAYTLIMCGRFPQAEKILTSALELAELRGDSVLMAYFYEGLGNLFFAWGYPDRSLHHFRRGQAVSLDKTLRNYYFHDSVGPIYQDWGDLDRAAEYLQQSVASKESLGMSESLPSAYLQLGDVLLDRGQALEAEGYYRKALRLTEEQGGDHFILVLTHLSMASCLGAQGRVVEAQASMDAARRESTGQSDYITALFRMVETLILLQSGDVAVAYPMLTHLLEILEPIGARKPLCVIYSALALFGVLSGKEAIVTTHAPLALRLAAEMNYVHDFLVSFDAFAPLLQLGMQQGWEVAFVQRVLVRLGQAALPVLQAVAEHSAPEVRLRAISPLAQIGGRRASEMLDRLLADKDAGVATLAQRHQPGHSHVPGGVAMRAGGTQIRLELLGPVRIHIGDTEITSINWVRRKSRDLLVYLAHLGAPANKERIIEALWPEASAERASGLLHAALHNLRRILGRYSDSVDPSSLRGGRHYGLPEATYTDRARFQALLGAAERSRELAPSDVLFLEEGVALYRGDYLEGMDYSWVLPEQEYLRQLHNDARHRLSLHYLNAGNHLKAIIHLERLVHDNPLTEEYYLRLLRAYALIGDLQAIGAKYRRLKAVLREELGLQPSAEIDGLYTRLIGGG